MKEYTFSNTEVVIKYSDDAFELLCRYYSFTKTSIAYEPYGTLKSIITSVYETTNPLKIMEQIGFNFLIGDMAHNGISWFIETINQYFTNNE